MTSYWEIQRVRAEGEADDMHTYVSQPDDPGKRPAVIVIMEAFGVNEHIQDVADRFASEGYFAVAPALYHRLDTSVGVRGTNPVYDLKDWDNVKKAMGSLNDDEIILDVNTTIEWLQRHPRVQGDSIGIIGFCVGGRITYLAAGACRGLSAASVFYGGRIPIPFGDGPSPFDRTANVQCPVLGSFGADDQAPSPEEVGRIEAELKKHGKVSDFKIYSGATHGFFCDVRESYQPEAANDAWERTLAWFKTYLKPA